VYSTIEEITTVPFNGDIEDLDFDSPTRLYQSFEKEANKKIS
jgi:hypothetical protein